MGFRSIFWGILFFFDFRLQGVDVLPDFIGYILIYSGCASLLQRYPFFHLSKLLSMMLILLSLFDVYQIQTNRGALYLLEFHTLNFLLNLITTVFNVILVYHLCIAVEMLARLSGNYELGHKAIYRWKLYLFLQISVFVIAFFSIFIPFLALMVIPLFVFSIVVLILLMTLMSEADRHTGTHIYS